MFNPLVLFCFMASWWKQSSIMDWVHCASVCLSLSATCVAMSVNYVCVYGLFELLSLQAVSLGMFSTFLCKKQCPLHCLLLSYCIKHIDWPTLLVTNVGVNRNSLIVSLCTNTCEVHLHQVLHQLYFKPVLFQRQKMGSESG